MVRWNQGLSDPGSNLGRGTALSSWARHFTFTLVLIGTGEVIAGVNSAIN